MVRDYRDLIAWQKGMDLACQIPDLVARLPRSEQFSIGEQLRRAAVSIPANIAEGYGRRTRGEYLRFLAIANGSLRELQTLVMIAERRGLAPIDQLKAMLEQIEEAARILTGLNRSLVGGKREEGRG